MSKSDLHIDVLGTEIDIATDEEPEYLSSLLDKFRQTVKNVQDRSGLKDPLKIAVLTGFLLCDDLEKAETGGAKNKRAGEVEELTLGIISRLDEALKASATAVTNAVVSYDTVSDDAEPVYEAKPEKAPEPTVPDVTIYKLENVVKNYDWGSPEWLPAFLGKKNISRIPWAELWMGVNPSGPSRVIPGSCPLSELIGQNPRIFLGKETADRYGTLPFLLKIIAAAKPLSIQVHPNAEQARQGFERENREGIPLDAPNRNYRDPNLKSEILCALGPFATLCGFRKAEEIALLMDILLLNTGIGRSGMRGAMENLVLTLKKEDGYPGNSPLKDFLSSLFALDSETLLAIGLFIKTIQPQLEREFPEYRDEWQLCSYLATLHPGDSGIIAPLYLNILELEQEEAIFIPAGTPHSYINGIGIELLSDSDNVLRGGLTSKHVDHAELMKIMDFSEFMPEIMQPSEGYSLHGYPAGEFTLSVIHGAGSNLQYSDPGPSIMIVTEGSAFVAEDDWDLKMPLEKGESVFIPAGKKAVFSGIFTAYIASCKSL